jgi:hypothetical protein
VSMTQPSPPAFQPSGRCCARVLFLTSTHKERYPRIEMVRVGASVPR